MNFDPSGMNQAFDRMRENAARQGKDMATQQAGFFLANLKREGRAIAPTPDRIYSDVKAADFKIKRKSGVSVAKEIKRRIRARGTFGRAWKIIKVTSERFLIRIWMENTSAESLKVDNMKGVSDRAEKKSGQRFKDRLNRLADSITSKF